MAKKQVEKGRARKTSRKAANKRQRAKKSVGKKADKKAAGKSVASKSSARKTAAKRVGKTAGKTTGKKASKKNAAKKSANAATLGRKSGVKSVGARKAARKKTGHVTPASVNTLPKPPVPRRRSADGAAVATKSRLPLTGALSRPKTARGRLAQKRGVGKHVPARDMALRTSLARRPQQAARQKKEVPVQPFEASQLGYREATRQDWPVVRRLLIEAFGRAAESEAVESMRASRDLVAEFVAAHAGRIVAYIGFCSLNATIDGRPFRAAGLSPLAVAGEVEGKGVGTRLTVYGLENIRGLGNDGVFVLGEPRFYARFGFSGRLAERFASPWPGPHYMALEFEPGVLRGNAGETVWPEALAAL
jgi:putative acetyltransferase